MALRLGERPMTGDEQRAELTAAITEGIPELSAADGRLLADALMPVMDRMIGETSTEYAVRNPDDDWVYALPRLIPKFLYGKRGTREAAEWHLRQLSGPDPEDQGWAEIVHRQVGPWEVAE
jgi:hypothetical protein